MWDIEIDQTIAHAAQANKVIEQITAQLGHYTFENCGERLNVALPLLKASIDIGAAATRLLMLDPVQYGGAAEAMLRPQLERYLRAIYFASPNLTTDSEVRAFLDDDEISVSFRKLTESVADEVVRQIGKAGDPMATAFSKIVILEKDDLHGAVHGGRMVVLRYLNESLAYNPWTLSHGLLVQGMMLLGLLAFSQAVHLHGSGSMITTSDFARSLVEAMPAFKQVVESGVTSESRTEES